MRSASVDPRDKAPREPRFLLAPLEQRVLRWLALRIPARVLPDHLTLIGVVAALGIAAAYGLSIGSSAWLWAASALLVVHWLGDSLDGTVARVRRIERPHYGYYVDHLTDAFATAAIGIGLGLSPYMLFATGLAIVIAYLLLSINVYLETYSLSRFRAAYGGFGPTEARLALIALNVLLALGSDIALTIGVAGLGPLDLVAIGVAALMGGTLASRAVTNLRTLAIQEPSARHMSRLELATTHER